VKRYFERWFSFISSMIGIKSFLSGVHANIVKRICKPKEQENNATWLQQNKTGPSAGSLRYWKRFSSTDTGCRLGPKGQKKKTFVSRFADEEHKVKAWSQRMMEQGFELCMHDLTDEFILLLECVEDDLTTLQADQGWLSKAESTKLKHVTHRLTHLKNKEKPNNRHYANARLGYVCKLVQRLPGNVVPFTALENELIVSLSWRAWDWLVDKIARGSVEDLRNFVHEAQAFVDNKKDITVVAQDAVPVYLDMSTGRLTRKPDDGPNQDDIFLT